MKKQHNPLEKMNASAGSGKTYSLTDAFVNLLFDSDLAPCESCRPRRKNAKYAFSELLAITFTNLAANQMKEKVIEKLKEYAFKKIPCADGTEAEEKSVQAHTMLETVFQQYGALNIRTIDSLLNQLVGLFALELGYPPQFETSFGSADTAKELYDLLAEQSIDAPVYAEVFRELCRNAFSSDKYDSFLAKRTLAESVLDFVQYSILNNDYFTPEIIKEQETSQAFFLQELQRAEEPLKELAKNLKNEIETKNILVTKRFLAPLENGQQGDFSSAYWQKESFADLTVKQNTADTQEAESLYGDIKQYLEKRSQVLLFTECYRTAVPCIKLSFAINLALAAYEKDRQSINTQKIPYIIAGILGSENWGLQEEFLLQKKKEDILLSAAFCRLGTRLKHILYDEFQDTSTAQWLALKDLSAEALAGGGSVLFVGDVKQAIYGWRGGKASLFDDAPEELKKNFGELEDTCLPCNWRSLKNIVDWNNAFFDLLHARDCGGMLSLLVSKSARDDIPDELLRQAGESLANAYKNVRQDIDAARLPKVQGKGVVEVHTLKEPEKLYDVAVLALIPEMVQNLYKRHKEYGKIAVLTVSNAQAAKVSQLLLQHGIPVVSQGSLGLKEHPVIAEVIALMRFLADPLNDGAFCQVLLSRHILPQGFYAACPRERIVDFLAAIRKTSCFTAFAEAFPAVWQKYFHAVVDGANLGTAYDMLCELYSRMGIEERNPQAGVYLLRLKEIAHLAEENGVMDLNAFLRWWDENGDKEKAPLPEGLNSVSVMTVHKSKGLEFDAVIMPFHDFNLELTGEIHKIHMPYGSKTYPLYSRLKREHGTPYYSALFEKIKECINVLYVGWTRAKAELHIFMPTVYRQDAEGAGYFYRFLQAMLAELKNMTGENALVFTETEDVLHFGENVPPVLAEKSLRMLECALGGPDLPEFSDSAEDSGTQDGQDPYSCIGSEEKEKLAALTAEYLVEKKDGEKSVSIGADDIPYAAGRLSRLLLPAKSSVRETEIQSAEEREYNPEHSMDWLPQLRIFRSDLEQLQGLKQLSSNQRGTLVHKSLEYLVFSGNLKEDCRRACAEAMKFLPYGRFAVHSAEDTAGGQKAKEVHSALFEEIQKKLHWAASLREPYGGAEIWFKHGYREHALADDAGNLFRVDLLVELPEQIRSTCGNTAYVAVDYKTGYLGQSLPVEDNVRQIKNYIRLLQAVSGKKAVGLLLYLDAEQYCTVEE